MITEQQKYDLYIDLHNNTVTSTSKKEHCFAHNIKRDYYYFGQYVIIHETQQSYGKFGISCDRVFILKKQNNKTETLVYYNTLSGEKNDVYDVYVATRNKLYNRPYTDPYRIH